MGDALRQAIAPVVVRVGTGVAVSAAAAFALRKAAIATGTGWQAGFIRWDAGYYLAIATRHLYTQPELRVFFPGYPLLIRVVSSLPGVSGEAAALAVSWLALLAAVAGLVVLLRELGLRAEGAMQLLLWFPVSVFLLAGYTESLFLATLLWFLVFVVRERWWTAALLGLACSLVKPLGVFVAAALLLAMLLRRRPPLQALACAAVAAGGMVADVAYMGVRFGQPLAFVSSEKFWQLHATWPFGAVVSSLAAVVGGDVHPLGVQSLANTRALYLLDDAMAVLGLAAVVALALWARRDRRLWPMVALSAAILLASVCSAPYQGQTPEGVARTVLVLPAVYVVAARVLTVRRTILALPVLVAVALGWQVVFNLGYWLT